MTIGLKILTLLILVSVMLVFLVSQNPQKDTPGILTIEAQQKSKEYSDRMVEVNLWNDIQQWRASEGLPQYKEDQNACIVAEQRAREATEFGKFSHADFNSQAQAWLKQYGWSTMQENLLGGHNLLGWLVSEPHKKTLLDSYTYSCVRCFEDKTCAHIFVRY